MNQNVHAKVAALRGWTELTGADRPTRGGGTSANREMAVPRKGRWGRWRHWWDRIGG